MMESTRSGETREKGASVLGGSWTVQEVPT